ncbi:acyltransferase family protein [Paraburkholderia megapolitana]|uniref:acyltransferase family protein n=1 Tax=Paraburkholderia megapolitana TaxID=420953 RepID=UPI00201327E0|nr:acyltransferase [Paraburkholderia megapolitana]
MRANPSIPVQSAKSLKIDAIRFMAAAWVVFYHFGPPPFKSIFTGHLALLGGALWSGLVVLFAGPAAVIVFFVISGYCIHNAYHRDASLRPVSYFVSRYVRIGVPLAVVALVSRPVGDASTLLESVLWSLYCELVYYTVYPLVRQRFHRVGEMIVCAVIGGALMVWLTHTQARVVCDHCVYQNYGVAGTSLLYFPGWLLGSLIADMQRTRGGIDGRRAYSQLTGWIVRVLRAVVRGLSAQLVAARVALVAAASLTFVLASSSHIKPAFLPTVGPDISLTLFQFFAAAWIAAETTTPARESSRGVWARLAGSVHGRTAFTCATNSRSQSSARRATRQDRRGPGSQPSPLRLL